MSRLRSFSTRRGAPFPDVSDGQCERSTLPCTMSGDPVRSVTFVRHRSFAPAAGDAPREVLATPKYAHSRGDPINDRNGRKSDTGTSSSP